MGHGTFSGEPETAWLTQAGTPDRDMRLLRDISFTDPAGTRWSAPAGSVIDGASIPRALWTVVGSPYTGDCRRASIVHDIACVQAAGDRDQRRAADRMFFHGCRADGCSIRQAAILYLGVRVGAAAPQIPAWRAAVAAERDGPRIRRTGPEARLERDFEMIAERVLAPGETDEAEQLEARADEALLVMSAAHSLGSGPTTDYA